MPLPVSNLTPESSDKDTTDAVNASFAVCMKEPGKTQEQCAGMIYGIAREKTGKDLQGAKQR
jgi:hypothetical protein